MLVVELDWIYFYWIYYIKPIIKLKINTKPSLSISRKTIDERDTY